MDSVCSEKIDHCCFWRICFLIMEIAFDREMSDVFADGFSVYDGVITVIIIILNNTTHSSVHTVVVDEEKQEETDEKDRANSRMGQLQLKPLQQEDLDTFRHFPMRLAKDGTHHLHKMKETNPQRVSAEETRGGQ
jgi:hypothetical protein